MKEKVTLRKSQAIMIAIIVLVLVFPLRVASVADSLTSSPPQACARYGANPVLGQQTFAGGNGTSRAFVMYNGTAYNAWFTAPYGGYVAIGLATSPDGIFWRPYPGPVLQHGGNGSWDSSGVLGPTVLWNGSYYLMYFTGLQANATTSTSRNSIGVAFSRDMIHWREYAQNPVLRPGPGTYDSLYIRSGSVIYDGAQYKMWYTGAKQLGSFAPYSTAVDYATSSDGLHWTKYASNPVVTGKVSAAVNPAVVKVGQTYFMAYTTDPYVISSATSSDGVSWKTTGTVLLAGTNVSSDWEGEVDSPSIVISGTSMLLWYTGYGFWTPPQPPAPPSAIGLAYCSLVLVTTTSTVTSIETTTLSKTFTSVTTMVSTLTQTSTKTETLAAPEPSVYEYLSAVLVVALVVAVGFALRRSR